MFPVLLPLCSPELSKSLHCIPSVATLKLYANPGWFNTFIRKRNVSLELNLLYPIM